MDTWSEDMPVDVIASEAIRSGDYCVIDVRDFTIRRAVASEDSPFTIRVTALRDIATGEAYTSPIRVIHHPVQVRQ